jgi:hypothetical protein
MTQWIQFVGPHFTIQVPSEWVALSSTKFQVMFLAPPLKDGRSLSLVLVMQPSDLPLEDYVRDVIAKPAQSQANFTVLSQESFITNAGTTGILFVFSATYLPNQTIIQRHIVFKYENTVYWFLNAIPTDIPDEIRQKVDDIFQNMLKTFTFTQMDLESLLG